MNGLKSNQEADPSGLADVIREFTTVYCLTRRVSNQFRQGELRFEDVTKLIGDDESSALFRLKERCHALFRRDPAEGEVVMRREALFDLAVGSLFHEAMKFRENFYQRESYGPKVRALRKEGDPDTHELFREFEKILSVTSERLEEALQETDVLLAQTRQQFRVLLGIYKDTGHVARFLVENGPLLAEVFVEEPERLLEELYGSSAAAYERAARSYLDSGYFDEAKGVLHEASSRGSNDVALTRLTAYAEGMSAYLCGEYTRAVDRVANWLDAVPSADEARYAALALSAFSRIDPLLDETEREALGDASALLTARLQEVAARA